MLWIILQPYVIIWLHFYPGGFMESAVEKALQIIKINGGTIRTKQALEFGIHPRTLYALRDNGKLDKLTRGLYRLSGLPPLGDPDLAIVASRIPHGIVCLISALALHELTTQIPHEVHLALPRAARYPIFNEIPIAIYRYAQESYVSGVMEFDVGGAKIQVFSPEKTIADCFKYRNKIGLDLSLEALSLYRKRKGASLQQILEFARINRVANHIKPYLEAII